MDNLIVMNEPKVLPMGDEELQRKLLGIRQIYGINAEHLVNLLKSPEFGKLAGRQLSKHAMRKTRRGLTGSSNTFQILAQIIERHKASLKATHDDYASHILSRLEPGQREAYVSGNWTPEVLEIVSVAQRKFFPQRPPSRAEMENRVSFQPHGNYRRKWNR